MKSGSWWPVAVVAVLAVTVGANAFLLYEANDRDAAVVEPDYYRRAVDWDSTLAQESRNQALGWALDARLGPVAGGAAELRVRILDRQGVPLQGAAVTVTAIHNLDAAHPLVAPLAADREEGYGARLPLRRSGLWELRFDVVRGSERFTAALHRVADGTRTGR